MNKSFRTVFLLSFAMVNCCLSVPLATAQGGVNPKTTQDAAILAPSAQSNPDLVISHIDGSSSIGSDKVSLSPDAQTLTQSVPSSPLTPIRFAFSFTNNDDSANKYLFTAVASNTIGCNVQVFSISSSGVAMDITTRFFASSGYAFGPVSAGASARFQLVITPTQPITGGPPTVTISAHPSLDLTQGDCVRAVVNFNSSKFSLVCEPAVTTCPVGHSRTVNVIAKAASSFTGDVTIASQSVPNGTSLNISPTILHLVAGSSSTAKMLVTSTASILPATSTISIIGTAAGGARADASVRLAVTDYSLSFQSEHLPIMRGGQVTTIVYLNALNDFTGSVSLSASVMDAKGAAVAGATAHLTPVQVGTAGQTSADLTISALPSTALGRYFVKVTGVDAFVGLTRSVLTDFTVGGLSLTPASDHLDIPVGQTKTVVIAPTSPGVTLPALNWIFSSRPPGMTATMGVNGILTIAVGPSVLPDKYPLIVSASDSTGLRASTEIDVNVTDFSLTSELNDVSVAAGGNASLSVGVVCTGSFSDTIHLSAVVPQGLTASFAPISIDGTQTSQLTVSAAADLTPGSYPITVVGASDDASGSPSHRLTLNAVVCNGSIVLLPRTAVVIPGQSVTVKATVTANPEGMGTVKFVTRGFPAGVTASPSPATLSLGSSASGFSNVLLTASPLTATGSYVGQIGTQDSSGRQVWAPLGLTVADFGLGIVDENLSVYSGSSERTFVKLNPIGDLSGVAVLSATSVPSGMTVSFQPNAIGPGQTSTVTVKSLSTPPGAYRFYIQGVLAGVLRSVVVNVKVVLPRTWTVGSAITGGLIISPTNLLVVEPGSRVPLEASLATDVDHWTDTSGASGNDVDEVETEWKCTGGSVEYDRNGGKVWVAPRNPGQYVLTCTVDDSGTEMALPNAGTRNDVAPTPRSVNVVVAEGAAKQTWSPGTPISGVAVYGIKSDEEIQVGSPISLNGTGSDLDHWKSVTATGAILAEGNEPDKISFSWACTSGAFVVGYDSTGQPVMGPTSTLARPDWVAPSSVPTSGRATITLTVGDSPEDVTRDDLVSVSKSVTVSVVSQIQQRVSRLQYATYNSSGAATWHDVPLRAQPNFPLTVVQGDVMTFRAIKANPLSPWPTGLPSWSGDETIDDSRDTASVYFTSASQTDDDLRNVTVTCVEPLNAEIRVQKRYQVVLQSVDGKSSILGAGMTSLSQTQVACLVQDFDGAPVPSAQVELTSVYLDSNFRPSDNAAGVLSSKTGTHPASAVHKIDMVTDSHGIAVATLTSSIIPSLVADTALVAKETSGLPNVDPTKMIVTFSGSQADMPFKAWSNNLASGHRERTAVASLFYGESSLIGRGAQFVVKQVLDQDGKNVSGSAPSAWVTFDPATGSSDSLGQIATKLVWVKTGVSADDYSVLFEILDSGLLQPASK